MVMASKKLVVNSYKFEFPPLIMALNAMEFLPSFPTVVLACISVCLLFVYYLVWKPRSAQTQTSIRKAPEAAGAWPIIGHIHLVGGSKFLHIILGSMADQFGPFFTFKLGMKPAIVVSSWELAKECLTTHDRIFATRPKSVTFEVLGYNYALFALAPYGNYWRQVRKIATLELLSQRRLEQLGHIRQSEAMTSMKELHEQWINKKKNGVLVEMKRWFGDLTLNVIVRMLAGKRFHTEDEESIRFQKVLREFFEFLGMFIVSDAIPSLRWLDLGGHEKAMKRTAKELDNIIGSWLEEHKKRRATDPSLVKGNTEQDFIDVMLSNLTGDVPGYDADTIIKSMCLVVLAGGTDTTSITLTWALSLLLNNPHALKKAQEELDLHVGRDRRVEESDMKKLVYLQAIFKETLRLYPAAPLSAPHESMEDCTLGGYHVPKGTRLVVNLWKIQRDPRVWTDPCEFKPERFLTSHKGVDVRGQDFELLPFGSGRRMCPGMNLSLAVMPLTLASLLHGFEVTTVLNEAVDMSESFGLTNLKATPLEVLVTPRLSSNLYG